MNWIDIVLVLIVILAVIAGWYRGFISSTLGLLTWTGSFMFAYLFYPYVARFLDRLFDAGPWLLPLAFLLTAIVAGTVLSILAGYITRSIPLETHQNTKNSILGIIPGAVTGYLYGIIFHIHLMLLHIKPLLFWGGRPQYGGVVVGRLVGANSRELARHGTPFEPNWRAIGVPWHNFRC